jgi:hypothetical protein
MVSMEEKHKRGLSTSLADNVRNALIAADAKALDDVLVHSDHGVVRATAADLDADEAVRLMQECLLRIKKSPGRIAGLSEWCRGLLQTNVMSIAHNEEFFSTVYELSSTLRSRVKTYHSLLRLQGRLDALMSVSRSEMARDQAMNAAQES